MFNAIQTFFVDPAAVNNAKEVLLTSVDLYFKAKPHTTNNASGIKEPGVVIQICDADKEAPNITSIYSKSTVRNSYSQIFPLSDASVPSNFLFSAPVSVKTGQYYGIIVSFEDPGYELWQSKQGDKLVGTNTPSSGASGKYDGYLFAPSSTQLFNAKKDSDLKFSVNIAKFSSNTVSTAFVPDNYEFIAITNRGANAFQSGEYCYQDAGNTSANVYFYKTGTLLINSSSNTLYGNNTLFDSTITANSFVVLTDGTVSNTNLLQVLYVSSNTQLELKEKPTFSSTGYAGRYKMPPVGSLYYANYVNNNIVLYKSTANATHRFVNSSVREAVITAGGTSYTNSDFVVVSGGGSSLNAAMNVTTNSTGGIVSLNMTNTGLGFATAPTVTINTSTGSGATITVNTSHYGLTLVGSVSRATANIANIEYRSINTLIPKIKTSVPSRAIMDIFHNFAINDGSNNKVITANRQRTHLDEVNLFNKVNARICSRSIEVIDTSYLYNNDKSAVFEVSATMNASNTDLYETPVIPVEYADIYIFENGINNDATNEYTNQGNAICKHISTKAALANNKYAEDVRVILNAYKPANTDIKVYVKIHNTSDVEAFDDKNWSELELKEGVGLLSSSSDPKSYVELSYGFPQYPPTSNVLSGTVITSNNSATVNGSNTNFTTDLAVNDLVKIYSPIFPQNYQVGVVNSVVNTTQITLKSAVVNNNIAESVVGNGFKIDKLSPKNSAFNNIQFDNVVRYYNTSMVEFDRYDSWSVKIVLLADSINLTPRVDNYRAIGVSA